MRLSSTTVPSLPGKVAASAAGCAAMICAAPSVAWAAGGGHGFPVGDFVTALINFAVFAGLIYYFAGSRISAYFKQRSDAIREAIEEADTMRRQAEERRDELARQIDAFEKEREELVSSYREQGQREKDKLVEDAKRQIEKMRADAERTIEQEKRKAIAQIERQVVEVAINLAKVRSAEQLDGSKHKALVDAYVEDLDQAAEV